MFHALLLHEHYAKLQYYYGVNFAEKARVP